MNNFPFPGGKGVTEEAENAVGLGEIRFVRFNEKTASVLLSYEGESDVLLVFANEEILPALSESLAGLTDDFYRATNRARECSPKTVSIFIFRRTKKKRGGFITETFVSPA